MERLTLPQINQLMKDNQMTIQRALSTMNEKIEDTVHSRLLEMNLQTQLSSIAATEMKLRELLDA